MADSDLQERLRESAKAFDGLLSLIPAQIYYGEGTNEQWKRTKQSKAEKKAAKLGKLDPDSEKNRTAMEVLEERARNKRKLQELEQRDDGSDGAGDDQGADNDSVQLEGIELEQSLKKQKTADEDEDDEKPDTALSEATPAETDASVPLSTLSAKEQKKLLKKQKKQEKKSAKVNGSKEEDTTSRETVSNPAPQPESAPLEASPELRPSTEVDDSKASPDSEMETEEIPGLSTKEHEVPSQSPSVSSQSTSPVFDDDQTAHKGSLETASVATSIASATPSEKPKHAKLPASSSDAFKARLAARIEELRKARKADGTDGRPPQTRQELIESRRQKQAQRKAHKKEVRRLAKEEEDRKREEALVSARTSPGGFMSPLRSDASDAVATNFAFGRIAFGDGAQMSHDLSYVKEDAKGKKKGPSDPKTALAKLEAQKKRVAGMPEDKRKEVLEKETWLAARRRAEGEKVRDDEAMLKKAVKRKDQAKKKSEREWAARKEGVEQAMQARQKKREDNLRKRREEKMLGKAGKKKKGVATKGGRKSRPGFEGVGLGGGKRK
ncbi:hypothetical protein RB597_001072 [Gaeumannomyces tritici]